VPSRPAALTRTVHRIDDAEAFLARLWTSLEKHGVETPALEIRYDGSPRITITARFPDARQSELLGAELAGTAR
jgi:hypothetical protein